MAEVPKAKPPEGGKGKGLGGKVGGIPIPVIVVGVLIAIGIGLYIRSRSATAATTAAATPASGTDTSGGAGSAAATPQDLTPVQNLADSLNGLSGILGAGGVGLLGGSGGTTFGAVGTDTTVAAGTQLDQFGNAQPTASAVATPVGTQSPPISNATPPQMQAPVPYVPPSAVKAPGPKAVTNTYNMGATPALIPNANAFGGIVSEKKNAAGVNIITYGSGRVVEQAPGKTAYVAKKGK